MKSLSTVALICVLGKVRASNDSFRGLIVTSGIVDSTKLLGDDPFISK